MQLHQRDGDRTLLKYKRDCGVDACLTWAAEAGMNSSEKNQTGLANKKEAERR